MTQAKRPQRSKRKKRFKRRRKKNPVPVRWSIPELKTDDALASWLGISKSTLVWLADPNLRTEGIHYRCRWIRKRSGMRLIESPKWQLKQIQQQILTSILNCIPVSEHTHGFTQGRNPVSFVAPHAGSDASLKMDLRQFFPSISCGRVVGIFKSIGYQPGIARLLATMCTTTTNQQTLQQLAQHSTAGQILHQLYVRRHLPQGAPTSPSLANLCAYRLDCRLAGLTKPLDGVYTRYADDLLFSFSEQFGADGQQNNRLKRLAHSIAVIAMEEGFQINFRKTRFMYKSQRQSAAGLVFNEKPNATRSRYDQLKAVLHNCWINGPESQNLDGISDFRGHLLGQIAWISQSNSTRGEKLLGMFEKIDW